MASDDGLTGTGHCGFGYKVVRFKPDQPYWWLHPCTCSLSHMHTHTGMHFFVKKILCKSYSAYTRIG